MTTVLRPVDMDIAENLDIDEGADTESDESDIAGLADDAARDTSVVQTDASVDDDWDDPDWDTATPAPVEKTDPGLTDQQRRVLIFERQWWRHAGSKEQAIREQFSLSATRYYQLLNHILDLPAALEFDAMVVGRLRRLRATRARTRMAR